MTLTRRHFNINRCKSDIFWDLTEISSWGQHEAHLGPFGPRWAPCWPHEPCYQGTHALPLFGCNPRQQIFIGPTWGPLGSCRPQMGPMLAPWALLSGMVNSVFRSGFVNDNQGTSGGSIIIAIKYTGCTTGCFAIFPLLWTTQKGNEKLACESVALIALHFIGLEMLHRIYFCTL